MSPWHGRANLQARGACPPALPAYRKRTAALPYRHARLPTPMRPAARVWPSCAHQQPEPHNTSLFRVCRKTCASCACSKWPRTRRAPISGAPLGPVGPLLRGPAVWCGAAGAAGCRRRVWCEGTMVIWVGAAHLPGVIWCSMVERRASRAPRSVCWPSQGDACSVPLVWFTFAFPPCCACCASCGYIAS